MNLRGDILVNLKKEKTKVNLKKEINNEFSFSISSYNNKTFMEEFMEGPYFHQRYFRGPWTWLASLKLALLSELLFIPLLDPMTSFLENIFGMEWGIAFIFSCVLGMFFLCIGTHFFATWIRRTFNL